MTALGAALTRAADAPGGLCVLRQGKATGRVRVVRGAFVQLWWLHLGTDFVRLMREKELMSAAVLLRVAILAMTREH